MQRTLHNASALHLCDAVVTTTAGVATDEDQCTTLASRSREQNAYHAEESLKPLRNLNRKAVRGGRSRSNF